MNTATQQIPAGYKQTDVGVIPDDWELKQLKQLNLDISDGNYSSKYPKSDDFKQAGVPFVRANNIKRMTVVDDDMRFISEAQHSELLKGHLKKDDILITSRGEIGQVAFVPKRHIDSNINAQLVRINTNASKLNDRYFGYFLSQNIIQEILRSFQTGSALKQLPVGRLVQLPVVLPLPTEQTAIANVLSDTDELIEKLEKLLAKKKAIKQGAMQELLTGKRRLPGFSGEWEEKGLGVVCTISTGKKDVNEGNSSGQYPFFTCSKKLSYSNNYSFDGEAIMIAGNGEVGHLHYYNGKFEAYQRTYVLQNFQVNIDYLWLQLNANFKKSLGIGTIGSTIPYIKKENIEDFKYYCPKDPKEQTTITNVLSDIGWEIDNLESELAKYRQIKTGMMQQLLTGKIRLIN